MNDHFEKELNYIDEKILKLEEEIKFLKEHKSRRIKTMSQFNYKSIKKEDFKNSFINKKFKYMFNGEDQLVKEICKQFDFKFERKRFFKDSKAIHLIVLKEKNKDFVVELKCHKEDIKDEKESIYTISFEKSLMDY